MTTSKSTVMSVVDSTPLVRRPDFLSCRDLCEVFCISPSTAYGVMNAMPHVKIGKSIRVSKGEVIRQVYENGGLPVARNDVPRDPHRARQVKRRVS